MTDASLNSGAGLAPSSRDKFVSRVVPFLAFAVVLAVIPAFGPSRTVYSLLNVIGVNIVFALSFNMLLGRAGLLSFGHAVYFGLGGYLCVHAMNWIADGEGFWGAVPIFALPILGFMGGALAGALIGWPSTRRAGTAFAMISLGVAELVAAAGFMFTSFFGGEMGVSGDRMGGPEFLGLSLGPVDEVYWFIAFWTFVGTVLIYAFTRTPLGRLSEATRDNPERVQFIGYNPFRVRYLVFIAAGGFAGLAGGMAAINYEIFTPESLSLLPSGFVLIMAYIGGIRYFAGPILGAVLLTYMQANLSDYSEAWLLYLGILFISIVMFAPDGLAGIVARIWTGMRQGGGFFGRWLLQLAGIALTLLGIIILVESAVRHSNGYGEVFEPFGYELPLESPVTWIAALVPFALGVALLRRIAARTEEANP